MKFMLCTALLAMLPPTRWFAFKRALLRLFGIPVGEGTNVCGAVAFYGGGKVAIGADCWIGIGTRFYTANGAEIQIGDRCDIAPEVSFTCGSHEPGDAARRAGPGIARSIFVRSGCWIGHRAMLMGGCDVGSGSLIGAGALVLGRPYPDSAMILGLPGRVVSVFAEGGGTPAGPGPGHAKHAPSRPRQPGAERASGV